MRVRVKYKPLSKLFGVARSKSFGCDAGFRVASITVHRAKFRRSKNIIRTCLDRLSAVLEVPS